MTKQAPYRLTKINEIKPYDRNPRIIPQAAVDAVAKSIQAFGFRQPIVVDGNGVILAGHTRYRAAQQLGLEEVPVIWQSDITAIQAQGYRIADNKTAELSAWDRDALDAEVRELAAQCDTDLDSLGLADWELERILHETDTLQDSLESEQYVNRRSGGAKLALPCDTPQCANTDTDTAGITEKREDPYTVDIPGKPGLKYFSTRKGIEYCPTGECPASLNDCIDYSLYEAAIKDLDAIPTRSEDAEFFKLAATRLLRFDYTRLAQYYASATDPGVRAAMERLTLIIPDADQVIHNGLAYMEEQLLSLMQEDVYND